jgi:hypothetical protein
MVGTNESSEFGGDPGLIQPEPHQLTPREQAMLERQLNPADPDDSVSAARARVNGQENG